MAMTAYLDIDQGSDFISEIELENDDGTPMSLAGCQVFSQFRKSYGSAIAFSFQTEISDALNGKFKLKLPGVTSSNIRPGRYLYDVEILTPSQSKIRVVEGIITLNAEITKIP